MKNTIWFCILLCCSLLFSVSVCGQEKNDNIKSCLKWAVSEAPIIFLAEVEEADFNPAIYSSNGGISIRLVKYKLKKTLKGKLVDELVWVAYSITEGAYFLDSKYPHLSLEKFKKGNEHILVVDNYGLPVGLWKKDIERVGKSKLFSPYTCAFLENNEDNLSLIQKLTN